MTSSPPSSRLTPAVPPESPPLRAGNWRQGLRSLWDLTRHPTARADDNHATPRRTPRGAGPLSGAVSAVRAQVRFLAYHRIKPHVPPLVRLRRGLPGYLILFAPHAFVPQRQSRPGQLPSQSAFYVISMHFTATPRIPPASTVSKRGGFHGKAGVEPRRFTADGPRRLRTL